MSLLIQPCLLNSLSDKGAVHDQNISKKKRTFLLILLILQRLRSFSKTWNFQLSIRFPACLKLIQNQIQAWNYLQLFSSLTDAALFFFNILKWERFFSFSQTWNFHQVSNKNKDSFSSPAYSKFIWKWNTSLKEFSICEFLLAALFSNSQT